MNDVVRFGLVGMVVLATHCLHGITGFGSVVLALPFLALLLGIKTAVPVLTVLAWILAGYIVLRSRRHIRWGEFGYIAVNVGIGLPVGIYLFGQLSESALKLILAAFMILVGARGLVGAVRGRGRPPKATVPATSRGGPLMRGVLLLGGIVHGAFACGGPFVVIYASKALTDKALFRVTLCLLWLTMNTIMIAKWSIAGGVWNGDVGVGIAVTLPFVVVGMVAGDVLHHRVSERRFRLLVYCLLLASGFVMAWSAAS